MHPSGDGRAFEPYLKRLTVGTVSFDFFFATSQARDWYDPIKPYALVEYEWALKHIPLQNQRIVDGGAHHGQYSVLFGLGARGTSHIASVDAVESNCAITRVNLAINGLQADIIRSAISQVDGHIQFSNESNGHILATGGQTVPSRRLVSVLPDATIVKLDVEGAEFWIIPDSIDALPAVHSWIVEIHPTAKRQPSAITALFQSRGYTLHWVNRARCVVEPYSDDADWSTHSTIFARRV